MTCSDASAADWQQRANHAAQSVTALFGRKLLFLPGTHLAAVLRLGGLPEQEHPWRAANGWPARLHALATAAGIFHPWHYWWQAHYVDCLVDAGLRKLGSPAGGSPGPSHPSADLASRLVAGIRLRNFGTVVNSYYDDMAWLALAVHRLDSLPGAAGGHGRRRNARIRRSLTRQFDAAGSDELGGGVFWSKKRDFKNTPANAPVALFYARTGQPAKAQALIDWLNATLFDPDQHLYLDGARAGTAGEILLERNIYTYNQGPVLGALLELGGDANLARAAEVVTGVDRLLTVPPAADDGGPAGGSMVLRCEGTGDGGLFTGILCRYLALAANDGRLPARTRHTAARLVTATAQALWDGRRTQAASQIPSQAGSQGGTGTKPKTTDPSVFSMHAAAPAEQTYPAGAAVELSTQLQAWMAIEAAAAVAAGELSHAILP